MHGFHVVALVGGSQSVALGFGAWLSARTLAVCKVLDSCVRFHMQKVGACSNVGWWTVAALMKDRVP